MPQSYGAHKGEIGIILASDLEPLTRGALKRFRRKQKPRGQDYTL